MDLQGKVIAALPQRSGVSQRGEWVTQDFVIETHDQYPRKMVFSVFGADRLQRFGIQVGQEVLVSFDIDAHEYNGRWFNNIRAYDVRLQDPNAIGMTAGADATFSTNAESPVATTATAAAVADNGANTDNPFPPVDGNNDPDNLPF